MELISLEARIHGDPEIDVDFFLVFQNPPKISYLDPPNKGLLRRCLWVQTPTQNVVDDVCCMSTPGKLNIAPENLPSQKEHSLPIIIFQGRAVKLRGCKDANLSVCTVEQNILLPKLEMHTSIWNGLAKVQKKYSPNGDLLMISPR